MDNQDLKGILEKIAAAQEEARVQREADRQRAEAQHAAMLNRIAQLEDQEVRVNPNLNQQVATPSGSPPPPAISLFPVQPANPNQQPPPAHTTTTATNFPNPATVNIKSEDKGDEELQNEVLGKGAASFVGDPSINNNNKAKVIAKKPEGTRATLDFTLVRGDDSDDDSTDPEQAKAISTIFKGVSSKFKKSKKSTASKKKLKTAESYGEWVRRIAKILIASGDIDLIIRYINLIERVGQLNKYKGWKIARAYGNIWIKEDRKRAAKGLAALDPSVLDPEMYAKAECKAGRPDKEKKESATKGKVISEDVYNRFPCDNCNKHGHWSLKCPHPCKFCGKKHNCRTCSSNPNPNNNNSKPPGSGGGQGSGGGTPAPHSR